LKAEAQGFLVHLAVEDTDSSRGGCTTYVAALLVEELLELGAVFTDYPNLVRLNPNIPYKTRGNGAVALRFRIKEPEEAFQLATRLVEEHSYAREGLSEPAVALLVGESIPAELGELAGRALWDLVEVSYAKELAARLGIRFKTWNGDVGLVGALAALGNRLEGDFTFEVLAYRERAYWGTERRVDPESVVEMERWTYPYTFNSYDREKGRVLITPRGPDPVLYGIRGEEPQLLLKAAAMLRVAEPIELRLIFRTNQGTGAHLKNPLDPHHPKPHTSGRLRGYVASNPTTGPGGHVYFTLQGLEGGRLYCAVYEPTGGLRRVARALLPGDLVEVGGGVRPPAETHPPTLNVEYILVLRPAASRRYVNPLCPRCRARMKSMGRGQGYRCGRCGHRDPRARKQVVELPRTLSPGLYLPPPRAQRHLTKPYQRYGLEKRGGTIKLIKEWFTRLH
jgi:tRNA(Ile2)-agmatinylcytidine synthase